MDEKTAKDMTKAEQVTKLLELGVKEEEVNKLRYESQRVKKLVELTRSYGGRVSPPTEEEVKKNTPQKVVPGYAQRKDPEAEILLDSMGKLYCKIKR